jgi:hypothetical protein
MPGRKCTPLGCSRSPRGPTLGQSMYVEAVEAAGDGLGSLCRDRRAFYYYHLHTSHISLFNDQTASGLPKLAASSSPRRPYASGREQPNLAPSTILAKMYFRVSVLPSRQRATPLAVFPLITPSSLRLLLPSIPSASPSFFSRWNPPGGDSIHPARLLSFTLFTPCLVCSSSTSTCTSLIEPHSPYGPAPTG